MAILRCYIVLCLALSNNLSDGQDGSVVYRGNTLISYDHLTFALGQQIAQHRFVWPIRPRLETLTCVTSYGLSLIHI